LGVLLHERTEQVLASFPAAQTEQPRGNANHNQTKHYASYYKPSFLPRSCRRDAVVTLATVAIFAGVGILGEIFEVTKSGLDQKELSKDKGNSCNISIGLLDRVHV